MTQSVSKKLLDEAKANVRRQYLEAGGRVCKVCDGTGRVGLRQRQCIACQGIGAYQQQGV